MIHLLLYPSKFLGIIMIMKLNIVGRREGGGEGREALNICARLANIVGGRLMIYSHFKIIYIAIEPNWNVSYVSHPKLSQPTSHIY